MALTVRDLKLATEYKSDFELDAETIRRAMVAEAARSHLQNVAREITLPRQEVLLTPLE